MKTYELTRSYLPGRTIGQIVLPEFAVKTLERAWLGNTPNLSCIPEGLYVVKRDKTGRFQYYAVTNVPGRTYIELHGGVRPTNSDGCILCGESFNCEFNLQDSAIALNYMLRTIGDDSFYLRIRAFNPLFDEWV